MTLPDFTYEIPLWQKGFSIIGIDEVGRGAFAGPVGIGGVVFSPKLSLPKRSRLLELGINDSKKLSPKKRIELSKIIKDLCLAYEISFIDVKTINEIGIGKATFMGMREVAINIIHKLRTKNPYLLIDAFEIPGFANQKGIIRGDSLSISIAAASIVAKVERDMLMDKLSDYFPVYGLSKHKGYGTALHRKAIVEYGLSTLHRTDFCQKTLTGL